MEKKKLFVNNTVNIWHLTLFYTYFTSFYTYFYILLYINITCFFTLQHFNSFSHTRIFICTTVIM